MFLPVWVIVFVVWFAYELGKGCAEKGREEE